MDVTIFSELSIDGKLTLKKDASSKHMLEMLDEESQHHIHKFRSKANAIMVGRKTITIDNPMLSVRYGEKNDNLLRIVPSQSLNFSLKEHIFVDNLPTLIVSSENNKTNPIVERIKNTGKECVFFGKEKIDFLKFFNYLEKEKGINNLIVEGGGTLNRTLLNSHLIDRIIILQLPIIVGNKDATSFVEDHELNNIIQCFSLKKVERFNDFLEITYTKNP